MSKADGNAPIDSHETGRPTPLHKQAFDSGSDESSVKKRRIQRSDGQFMLDARGEHIVTTMRTLCALPGFLATWAASDMDEESPVLFLDHDASDVRTLLNILVAARQSVSRALEIATDALRHHIGGLHELLDFVGIGWAITLRIPSPVEKTDVGLEPRAHCKKNVKLGLGVLQDLIDRGNAQRWNTLPQIALVDEVEKLCGIGSECKLYQYGGYVPLGTASRNESDGAHKQDLKLVLDLGASMLVRTTMIQVLLVLPEQDFESPSPCLSLRVEALPDSRDDPVLLTQCRFSANQFSADFEDVSEHLLVLPVPEHRRSFCRMLRVSCDAAVGCVGVELFGDLVQGIPSQVFEDQRPIASFSSAYVDYHRVRAAPRRWHRNVNVPEEISVSEMYDDIGNDTEFEFRSVFSLSNPA